MTSQDAAMSQVSGELVTAIACNPNDSLAPQEIVFIPEGKHRINPLSHPKGVFVNVPEDKGESIAATLNSQLQDKLREKVAPWFDIEHTRKFPASGYPKAFRYERGKGVMALIEWSGTGKRAIEDRDVRYFSPEFYIDEYGIPSGLPTRGPLGGLVTEPAFRDIGPIAASTTAGSNTNATITTMSNPIFEALAITAGAENSETEAVTAIEKMKAALATKEESIATLKAKIEELEQADSEAKKERANKMVKAAVADGRILSKDEDKQAKFLEKIAAGDSFAEEILEQLPKLNADLDKPIVRASTASNQDGETRITACLVKARAELGEAKPFVEIWARAAEIDPQAFQS